MNRKFLIVAGILYFIATILGIVNVLNGNFSGISWGFAPLGIFIWGDAVILGLFVLLGCIWLYFQNKPIWTELFFSGFFVIRSFVEILYALNAQFSDSVRPWELNWSNIEIVKLVGKQEMFVLWQLVFTCIFILSALSFVHFLKKYLRR